ncbi:MULTISPECIES: acyl-CoA dehydrogenase family protein [unclassified Variovorax]|jgi:cyclohexanecarboxyl-CoA dehydrogenase|uniref:acyl-CoA dehydrogenase family protein n=1 Tax=unclassified Variovorax TaxID=663243 RepID=UPI00086CB741|nr:MULTISPECIES: acyl-CoA dehydrogenase family protein [unclassified Variovorax]MBN8756623.1 acyl-CoA dehydrogenase family protein [Variovorax sp.]ODU19012.1 MAG: cyclohexanecarboxyl-CoA dehydrogenase [Variovorax sp. SCN 67-85]ODV23574.1 MAG: cyclohexanecarboxyl-CoA dehydrogenase [Variovorax sp. SCN 67-20]OJZ08279.1 MAG: cyclohexanecarboxyl-CoA dehydrogenase [Variovorax sp. 67-131]
MVLNDDQRALQESARRFARERLLPDYQKREKLGVLDRKLLAEMGSLGLIGVDLPERLGGLGADAVTTGIIAEELAYGDFNISAVPVGVSLNAAILIRHAQPEVVEEWVPRMIRGEAVVAICLTEPRGGSDASNLQLKARRDGNHYIVNGEKTSITFADRADAYLIFARTGRPEDGAKGVSAFFIPADTPGIQRTHFDDVGSAIIGRGSVFFDDVKVPASHRLGDEGKGFTQVMQGFDYSRALIALQCCGAAQASLDEAWAYAKEREAFGRPIGQFQGVSFPLAEGESHIAAVRQLSFHALALRDAGEPHTTEAAMVKWMGPKTAFDVIHQCLLTFGHYGWSKDLPHQQRMRDVMGLEIGDGTAGIMKLVIARQRIGRVAVQYLDAR